MTLCILHSKLYHINARSEPGGGERGKPPGLPQQQPHASIRTLESTSIPTGDVELSTSASNMGLARFTNALTTSHSHFPYPRARAPQSAHPYLPPSTRNKGSVAGVLTSTSARSAQPVGQLSPTLYPAPAESRYLAHLGPSRLPLNRHPSRDCERTPCTRIRRPPTLMLQDLWRSTPRGQMSCAPNSQEVQSAILRTPARQRNH